MQLSPRQTAQYKLAFISDGCTGGGQRSVGGKLDKQITPCAQHSLDGQILDLIGVIHWRGVNIVAVLNQQSKKTNKKRGSNDDN